MTAASGFILISSRWAFFVSWNQSDSIPFWTILISISLPPFLNFICADGQMSETEGRGTATPAAVDEHLFAFHIKTASNEILPSSTPSDAVSCYNSHYNSHAPTGARKTKPAASCLFQIFATGRCTGRRQLSIFSRHSHRYFLVSVCP